MDFDREKWYIFVGDKKEWYKAIDDAEDHVWKYTKKENYKVYYELYNIFSEIIELRDYIIPTEITKINEEQILYDKYITCKKLRKFSNIIKDKINDIQISLKNIISKKIYFNVNNIDNCISMLSNIYYAINQLETWIIIMNKKKVEDVLQKINEQRIICNSDEDNDDNEDKYIINETTHNNLSIKEQRIVDIKKYLKYLEDQHQLQINKQKKFEEYCKKKIIPGVSWSNIIKK